MELLDQTLKALTAANPFGFHIHYALKANNNPEILAKIRSYGLGVDCVSGNEVKIALDNGFAPSHIVLAGVGKSDKEIRYAIEQGIFSLNVESIQELQIINEIAGALGRKASVSFRINPAIDAGTHHYITTGSRENKFGISSEELIASLDLIRSLESVSFIGIHYHIGSQIVDFKRFAHLCERANELQSALTEKGLDLPHLNVGGGLGINYEDPDRDAIPDFQTYFRTFAENIRLQPGQQLHFELGRSVVAQCGSLITKVLYVKDAGNVKFAILDAGMSELMRPALYQAHHHVENLTSEGATAYYDVVGPICETSDTFQRNFPLPETSRGDLLAIRSVGAYGETMKNNYNARSFAPAVYSDAL